MSEASIEDSQEQKAGEQMTEDAGSRIIGERSH